MIAYSTINFLGNDVCIYIFLKYSLSLKAIILSVKNCTAYILKDYYKRTSFFLALF